jgi:hypothetical protein
VLGRQVDPTGSDGTAIISIGVRPNDLVCSDTGADVRDALRRWETVPSWTLLNELEHRSVR